ncbi:MAG: hypothetical protein A2Y36_01605 [Treponema sp. GWA1_62_8]|nr:MAG: hypothetical protein A2Y36_01605 [Treponema sp. GWA1_62_8]
MAPLVAFAFLAGIVTVLSPCILPVLPVVLSGSVGGGRARPYGIITGFVLSFAAFTLTLSALVRTLGINADVLRWIAAGIVLAFGLVMLVPALKERFAVITGSLGARAAAPSGLRPVKRGFRSGFVLGLSLGLVWTPCVGPIMASVISLALSSRVDAGSAVITLAYSLGTAVPLLLIMKGGRSLLNRVPFLIKNTGKIQKAFGVLMIAAALALFTGADRAFQTLVLDVFPNYGAGLTALEDNAAVRSALEERTASAPASVPGPGPEAGAAAGTGSGAEAGAGAGAGAGAEAGAGAGTVSAADRLSLGSGEWLNSPPLTLGGLKGKVVLVDFWTYSCVNCLRTLPYLRAWHDEYADEGLVIVGVHSPEFAFERSETNLRRAARELGVIWPIVQDNDFGIWRAYDNKYWPSHYLYGRDGMLLETHFGEGGYAETEALIRNALGGAGALGEAGALGATGTVASSVVSPLSPLAEERTPETYLGYGRGERFSSPETPVTDAGATYSLPSSGIAGLEPNKWAFEGTWTIEQEDSIAEIGSSLSIRFRAAKVHLVVNPLAGGAAEALVTVDGEPVSGGDVHDGVVKFEADRLYTLLDGDVPMGAVLRIEFRGRAAVYAFTFG